MKGLGMKGIGLVSAVMSGGQFGSPIYGASWTGAASPVLTRTDEAIGKVANAGVDLGVVVNDFDNCYPWSAMMEVTDALGNVFIRIPKFFIEKTAVGAARTWRISGNPFGNSYLPWCFWDFTNNVALPYVDVGKYVASLSGANKLESLADKYPLINKNIVQFRGYAQANGVGYQQLDIHVVDMLQVLFYVEFATINSQAIMSGWTTGQFDAAHTATVNENAVNRVIAANAVAALYRVGQAISVGNAVGNFSVFYGRTITSITVYDINNMAINFDGAAVNIAIGNVVWNCGWKNGFSSGIAAKSGSLVSNASGLYPCVYRGIENPWGNVWQCVDGMNINNNQAWVCKDATSFASNVFAAPYLQLGYINKNSNGWVSEMGHDSNNPFAELPIAVIGGGGDYYFDYYWQDIGQVVAFLGGSWLYGSYFGLSVWSLDDGSGRADIHFGGRLLKKAL